MTMTTTKAAKVVAALENGTELDLYSLGRAELGFSGTSTTFDTIAASWDRNRL